MLLPASQIHLYDGEGWFFFFLGGAIGPFTYVYQLGTNFTKPLDAKCMLLYLVEKEASTVRPPLVCAIAYNVSSELNLSLLVLL